VKKMRETTDKTDKNRLAGLRSALIQYNQGQVMGVIPLMLAEYAKRWHPYIDQRGEFGKLFQRMENSNANYPFGYMTNYYSRDFAQPTTPFYDGWKFNKKDYHLLTESQTMDLEQKFKVDEIIKEVNRSVQEIRDYVTGVVAKNAPIRRLKGLGGFYKELVAIQDDPWYYPEDLASVMHPKQAITRAEAHTYLGLRMPFHRELCVKLKPAYETFDILETKLKRLKAVLESISSDLPCSEFPEDTTIEELVPTHPPKAFIAHGGKSAALNKLCSFLEALGVEPLVVEIQPSEGRLTEPQVDEYMKQADCAIILAAYGHIVDVKTRKKHPRLNVVDELGRCRGAFPHSAILLLEKGVDLPSNVSGIVYERFTKQNIENALIKVAKELRVFGLIRPMKPGG